MEFEGKNVLVTGGSRGIGRAAALAFAAQGANVALSARGREALEAAAEEIQASGGKALAVPCDVTDPQQVEALAAAVQDEFGGVDVLVASAGVGASHKFLGHPDELWDMVLEVNLTGTYRVCKAVAPGMVAQKWGRIVIVASIAAKVAWRYMTAYTVSKHGLLGLARSLAVELNPHGVTANAICPGYVDTPMTEATVQNIVARTGRSEQEARRIILSTNPQGRLIQPEEVAALALLLATEAAGGITGQAVNVDGGAVMW